MSLDPVRDSRRRERLCRSDTGNGRAAPTIQEEAKPTRGRRTTRPDPTMAHRRHKTRTGQRIPTDIHRNHVKTDRPRRAKRDRVENGQDTGHNRSPRTGTRRQLDHIIAPPQRNHTIANTRAPAIRDPRIRSQSHGKKTECDKGGVKETSDSVKEFVTSETDKLEQQRQEAFKASGGLPFLPALTVGETKLHLYREIPRDGQYGKQFHVKATDGKDYAWTIRPKSPLYREIVKALAKAPLDITVVRAGTGKNDTRYALK